MLFIMKAKKVTISAFERLLLRLQSRLTVFD
nr:MAG TPA: hypothetical protein [Caudoviricetes sp.]